MIAANGILAISIYCAMFFIAENIPLIQDRPRDAWPTLLIYLACLSWIIFWRFFLPPEKRLGPIAKYWWAIAICAFIGPWLSLYSTVYIIMLFSYFLESLPPLFKWISMPHWFPNLFPFSLIAMAYLCAVLPASWLGYNDLKLDEAALGRPPSISFYKYTRQNLAFPSTLFILSAIIYLNLMT